jgi:Putative zinc-finger
MDCRTVHDHLSSYLDHDVPLHTRLVLDQHLESCPACCHELAHIHTITAWVRDFPLIEPSPMFGQQVREQIGRLAQRSKPPLFRRLAGAVPLQVAAAVAMVVTAALVLQMTPHARQGQVQHVDPPAHTEPWLSRERGLAPTYDAPVFEPVLEEPLPTRAPLVQVPSRWAGLVAQEEFLRVGREFPAMPRPSGMPAGGRVGEVAFFPSLTLQAADPVQAAQQIWELVPRAGGQLLQAQGMVTPADRASRGVVGFTLSITAERYETFLEAIHQLAGTTVTEERMAVIDRALPPSSLGSLWRVDHSQAVKSPPMTLYITILRR